MSVSGKSSTYRVRIPIVVLHNKSNRLYTAVELVYVPLRGEIGITHFRAEQNWIVEVDDRGDVVHPPFAISAIGVTLHVDIHGFTRLTRVERHHGLRFLKRIVGAV